jgi:chitinase
MEVIRYIEKEAPIMVRRLSQCPFNVLCCTFTLILSTLIFFPQPAIYAADVTLAWGANTEPDIDGYYIYYKSSSSGAPYNGTGADQGNSPIKITLAELADSQNPEYTIQGLSDTETTFFVATAYDTEGYESGYSDEVSYQPPSAPALTGISINGDDQVIENSSTDFTATANFNDGSTQTVTSSASWSSNSPYVIVNSNGTLAASEVSSDVAVTIQVSYTVGETTMTATKVVTLVDVPALNLAPNAPVIVYPDNGQYGVDEPLEITTDPFSDPNENAHGQSRWQISDQSDFSTLVVDITSDRHLTVFPVPHMILTPNQTYYVRVRFFDVYFEPSDWSRAVAFTTHSLAEDLNSNGIPDVSEVDDTVDFNLDGIPDNDQPEIIKCVQTEDGSAYIGVEKISSSIGEIEAMGVIDPDTITDAANRPADLIFGLFSYRLRVTQPGTIATLKIYFSGEVFASDAFFKYDTINGWYDYSEHTTFNHDGQSVTLELKDGGYGDSDGLANGIIVDPGGIASGESAYISAAADTEGSGSGSGCFIATAAFGSKFEKHVRLLRRFRDLYLMPHRIGRAFVNAYYRFSPPVANVIADHKTVRVVIRWSLVPLIGLSWMLLHFGAAPTGVLFVLMSTTLWVGYKRRWKAWRVKPVEAAAKP